MIERISSALHASLDIYEGRVLFCFARSLATRHLLLYPLPVHRSIRTLQGSPKILLHVGCGWSLFGWGPKVITPLPFLGATSTWKAGIFNISS